MFSSAETVVRPADWVLFSEVTPLTVKKLPEALAVSALRCSYAPVTRTRVTRSRLNSCRTTAFRPAFMDSRPKASRRIVPLFTPSFWVVVRYPLS